MRNLIVAASLFLGACALPDVCFRDEPCAKPDPMEVCPSWCEHIEDCGGKPFGICKVDCQESFPNQTKPECDLAKLLYMQCEADAYAQEMSCSHYPNEQCDALSDLYRSCAND